MRWQPTARGHQCLVFARMEEPVATLASLTLVTVWMDTMDPIVSMSLMPAHPTPASTEPSAPTCMPPTAVTVHKGSWDTSVNTTSMSVPAILVTMEEPVLTWWASSSVHVPVALRVLCVRRTWTIVMMELASMEVTVLTRLEASHVSAGLASPDQDARETSTSAWPVLALMKAQQTVSNSSTITNATASLAGEEDTVRRDRSSVRQILVTMEVSAG